MKKRKWIIILLVVSIVLLVCAMVGPVMSNVEQPSYEVISSEGSIDIRQYVPIIIAETEVQGEREEAIGKGFRLLADYIFGNNSVKQEIAMTAPVQQQNSKKISMTAPVQQQIQDGTWKVSFVMPAEYSIDKLPKPNNERVKLKEVLEKRYVVIQFSGLNSNDNIAQHEKILMHYIEANKIKTAGPPKYAFYNPPWTLPFMKRNEIMMQLEEL